MVAANASPAQTRARDEAFVGQCSLSGLHKSLPLNWPTLPGIPPSPKKHYRSLYGYAWTGETLDLEKVLAWQKLSDFELLLRLVDFTALRPLLAQRLGWQSGRGWEPFDPVSFFLLVAWQLSNRWKRSEVLKNLADPRYADFASWFGFREGDFPTEGGVRHFLTQLGRHSDADGETVSVGQGEQAVKVLVQKLNLLLVGSIGVMRQANLISPQAWQEALICPDGQLHDAASNLRCISVNEACYQPCAPAQPRRCPARDKERKGCDCNTQACACVCQYAPARDPQARFIWYTGSNQSEDNPNRSTQPAASEHSPGQGRYGYRSLPIRLAEALRRFGVSLLSDVLPANQPENLPGSALLLQLKTFYSDLQVFAAAGDAAYGQNPFLHTVYADLKALRVIDCHAHPTDRDKQLWPTRGYDRRGRPLCNYGYALVSNGFDHQRRTHKWHCAKACLHAKDTLVKLANTVYPPPECPYQADSLAHGLVKTIGECFPDGSNRLVRDIPVGSTNWKTYYHRARNAVEGRNAILEAWQLKRMPVFGLHRSKAVLFLADTLANLMALVRLIRDATLASMQT
jgi:hypothetical protein